MNRGERAPGDGKERGLYYGWIIVFVTFLSLLISFGIRSSFAVSFNALTREFGWTRADLSLSFAILTLCFAATQAATGWLMDKWKARLVIGIGIGLVAVSMFGMALADRLWQVHLLIGVFFGLGFGLMGILPASVLVIRWFKRRKGTALGVSNMGVSLGQMILAPVSMILLLSIGWRLTFVVLGAAAVVLIMPLVLLLIRDRPADMGLKVDGGRLDPAGTETDESVPDHHLVPGPGPNPVPDPSMKTNALSQAPAQNEVPFRTACAQAPMWLLAAGFFVCGFTVNIINLHFVVMAMDRGFTGLTAANALGLMGGMNLAGVLGVNILSDYISKRKIPLGALYAIRGLSFVVLLSGQGILSLYLFALLYGITAFVTSGVMAAVVGDLFGSRSMGQIYGFISMIHHIGGAIGTYLAGVLFDHSGSYAVILTVGAFMLGGAALATWVVPDGKPWRKVKPLAPGAAGRSA